MKNAVSKLLICAGILTISFGVYLLHLRHSPQILAFEAKPTVTGEAPTNDRPQRIKIPSIGVDLPVIPAITNGHDWETTHTGVSYLATSPIPGEHGNSIFYGHNWESLLKNLPDVKPGDVITIQLDARRERKFKVEYTAVVRPDQTYIIGSTNDSRITIYTCTGFLDSKRFVVVAKPI